MLRCWGSRFSIGNRDAQLLNKQRNLYRINFHGLSEIKITFELE